VITISGNSFTNSSIDIGEDEDVAQAQGGVSILNNTFPADSSIYDITVRCGGATVSGNTFYGSQCLNHHSLMLGSDSGYEVGDSLAINVYGNTWTQTVAPPAAGSLSYLLIVNKSNYNNIYNNTFTVIEPPAGSTGNAAIISCPGGQYIDFYNNTINANNSLLQLMRLLNWTTTDVTDFVAYNNIFNGTYADIVKMEHDDMTTNMVVDHCYFGGGVNFDSLGVDVDGDDSPWYGSANFTTEAEYAWAKNWGGYGPLTGITGTTQGFYPIGVATSSRSTTDPVITSSQAGFETPYDALQTINTIGATGIQLTHRVRNLSDLAAAIYWTQGYPADSSGTYASEFKGVLEVINTEE